LLSYKAFGLISVLVLLVVFSYTSIFIIQNKTFSSNINKLKYLEIQAKIYLYNIQNSNDIKNYILNDDKFLLDIQEEDYNSTNFLYYITIKAKNEPLRLCKTIIIHK